MKTEKNNINIIYVGRYNEGEILSGPEKTAKRIFDEHSKKSRSIFIQYFFDGKKYRLKQKLFGITKKQSSDNSVVYTLGIFKAIYLLKDIKPEIIHIITFERFAIIFFIYKLFSKVKIVYNEHGVVTYENYELKKLPYVKKFKDKICEKIFLKYSDKIIFTSEKTIDIAEIYFNINESKSVILANGVDEVFYSSSKTKVNDSVLKAVFIYKNELYKPGLIFLKKFIENFKEHLDIHIISKESIDLKNEGNAHIHFIKQMETDELANFYKDKDIFLSLNNYDTFSISTAEAMASGLIPIITKETGISRYIENAHNGFLVDFGNINQLKDTIMKVAGMNSDKRTAILQNSINVYEYLAWDKIYETYTNIYKSILK
ncbi:MAG: glycosyltransferase family 4 protein [Chlorobi bacterium]|nr:glycosyltransferase family 4 protein [Chlorobiota bacterium]MCI0716891.1 glycosyltransferase family 4 protein [Chlorobiota bacterium]